MVKKSIYLWIIACFCHPLKASLCPASFYDLIVRNGNVIVSYPKSISPDLFTFPSNPEELSDLPQSDF